MRFFAHDGKSTHGPAGIEELLKLPGFDGDTLVCPVGSDDSADWKPALAYPPFKKALLEAPLPVPVPAPPPAPGAPAALVSPLSPMMLPGTPALTALPPVSALPPMPAMLPPAPAPAPKTAACPGCAHANLEEARFCNACGARMDGKAEDISAPEPLPPVPVFPPAPVMPAAPILPPAPAPEIEAAKDPFARFDPLLSIPEEPAPLPDSPHRPLQPGKMGQLAELEDSGPAVSFSPDPAPLAPEPAPDAAAVPAWKRPPVLAAFAAAAALSAGLAYMRLGSVAAPEPVAELTPSAPAPAEIATPAPMIYAPPPRTSSPAMPPPSATKPKKPASSLRSIPPPAAAKPKRSPKPRRARAPKPAPLAPPGEGDTIIESRAPTPPADPGGRDPLLEALLGEATKPSAEPVPAPARKTAAKAPPAIGQRPAAAKPAQFSLPGLKRPVSASDRAAAAPAPGPSVAIAGLDAAPLSEPGKSSPPPGIEDQPAPPAPDASDESEQLALVQVHEQFDFCAQLLTQGAYGDHFDTCLCKDAREAAPYRGRRGFYVTAKKKDAGGGGLEASAKILSSRIDGGIATVTGRFSSGGADKGRTAKQTWKLEDGLWCQAP